jgi:nucleotide-binding universal stress UspA family protein
VSSVAERAPTVEDEMIKHILVALDGSEHGARALALAADIAVKYGAELHLVHVIPRLTVPEELEEFARIERLDKPAMVELVQAADSILAAARTSAGAAGVQDVRTAVATGDPAAQLLAYARDHSTDLLVMGRRGLGRIRGLLMGSVSSKVNSLAECPVVTVK